jgi:predicted AAA+ superfamily ATPase
MENLSKKESFKLLIKEFHTEPLPEVIQRDLEVPLFPKKIITIFGPRRSGKSFYFYTLIKKLIDQKVSKDRILYLNFEDDRILPLNFKELNSLLEAYFELYPENKEREIFLFFDEIQNIKNWEVFVRRIYDKEKVKIFITGSSSKLLSREIATSLRGRTISFALYPLNFKEFLRFREENIDKDFQYTSQRFKIKKLLKEYLEWGGFPEVVLEKDIKLKKKILQDYFNFLVYRDLAERFKIENTLLLKDILKFLFTNFTSFFSVNSYFQFIKQKVPVSRETISDYLSFIQETDYFFLLPQFSYSLKAQKINPKKIICLDNGLRNIISFRFSEDKGKLAENLVGNFLKWQVADLKEKEVFCWRNKREIDFVVKENNKLSALNVSFGEKLEEREITSLLEFKKNFKKTKELILVTKDLEKKEKGIKFIPLEKFLLS